MTLTTTSKNVKEVNQVVVRFAGDSGDGMQLTGSRFTAVTSLVPNDTATLPDYPAEIRAPAGTLAGVSSFQLHFSDHDILTPGDKPDVLVAMNPAALKAHLSMVKSGGIILVNSDSFDERSLGKAGYGSNPLDDGTVKPYRVYEIPMTKLTLEACKSVGVKPRDAERSKNFFALGLLSWMYTRPVQPTIDWIEERFASNEMVKEANLRSYKAGYNFGETAEIFEARYEVAPSRFESGTYTNVPGNTALAWGLVVASRLAKMPLFLGSYPITPASDILHELAKLKNFGVRTFQAEDEIAGAGSALGAAYGGCLGVTTTSGPGIDLKAETIGLAAHLELPMVIVDIQRVGPSTGIPTKTEQADLLAVVHGRHGESPVPVVAAMSPGHAFDAAIEACRIAIEYRTPVYLLSDGYVANSSEPWRLPDLDALPAIDPHFLDTPNHVDDQGNASYWPYVRDPDTFARQWAIPGTPGLEHRMGGLEHADGSGNVAYDTLNHEKMTQLRQAKLDAISKSIPLLAVDDPDGLGGAEVLAVSWGSTYPAVLAGVRRTRKRGLKVAMVHLVHLNPFPSNLGEILGRYRKIIVPEINMGQLWTLIRARYLVDAESISKVQGIPFKAAEIESAILDALDKRRVARS
ncbi:MAG: 2-oxoacid:acceptor oxidoreductase subunit alpha [Actinobacteria bacterium]|nr:2-oxoacid:acceptor oxidoreductase subunit alpha [Actinomycetota bacterium]